MFKLTIETKGDAFAAVPEATAEDGAWRRDEEVARLLKDVAARIKSGNTSGTCMDENGNTCGQWEYVEEPSPHQARAMNHLSTAEAQDIAAALFTSASAAALAGHEAKYDRLMTTRERFREACGYAVEAT
jgi:hypothetical protein